MPGMCSPVRDAPARGFSRTHRPRTFSAMTPDPLFDLTGKIALVTGGSRGLGYQMARAFAERGADVIVASRKIDNCERVAEEIRALGRRALALQLHAARWDSIDAMLPQAYDAFGRIDI